MRSRGRIAREFVRLFTVSMALVVVGFAVHQLFFRTKSNGYESSRQPQLRPGKIRTVVVEQPDTARPAPPAITIGTTLDRTAPIERYLRAAGLDAHSARRWAAHFTRLTANRYFHRGHPLTIYKDPSTGEMRGFKYDLNYKTSVTEAQLGDGVIKAAAAPIQYVDKPVKLTFKINDGFRRAAALNGIPAPIIETLENAFADRHDLDRLARGSAVKLVYREKVSRDGSYRLAEGVEAAQIKFGGRTMNAFAFDDAEGRPHLYDSQGRVLGRRALRFPLHFKYISSGFSFHRYHPILHEYRPHLGIDLVARYGAPVESVADGRVVSAGWQGELGNCVRIRHAGGIVSLYGHLSKISAGIVRGAYVRVSEVIGRVGSTGLSTGPHLHFGIEKDGRWVDPLHMRLAATHEPMSPRMQPLFNQMKRRYEAVLATLPDLTAVSLNATGGANSSIARRDARKATAHRVRVSSRNDAAGAIPEAAESYGPVGGM
ncbi:MAG: M23 family metallopeptidase [Candidatus Binataceae bacterium]